MTKKIAYQLDEKGFLRGPVLCQPHPTRVGEFLTPRGAICIEPPKPKDGFRVQFDGAKWNYVEIEIPVEVKREAQAVKRPPQDLRNEATLLDGMVANWKKILHAEVTVQINELKAEQAKRFAFLENEKSEIRKLLTDIQTFDLYENKRVEQVIGMYDHLCDVIGLTQKEVLQHSLVLQSMQEKIELMWAAFPHKPDQTGVEPVQENALVPVEQNVVATKIEEKKPSLWKRITFQA